MSLKKLFNNVRKWVGEEYTDEEIKGVLEVFFESDILYPDDFYVSTKKENLTEEDKKIFTAKVNDLFDHITDEGLINRNKSLAKKLHKLIWGLVMVAKFGDRLQTTIPYDVKGGISDVAKTKGLDYPISLEKTRQIFEYLRTKKIHNATAMYEDLKHTKAFIDLDEEVIGTALASYLESNGKTTAEEIHADIRSVFLSPSLNKRGGKL